MPAVLYARHLDAGPRPLRSIRELLIPSVKNYRVAENGSQLVLTNFFAKLLQLFDCYESVVLHLFPIQTEYVILILNGHDIKIRSRLTGHEWIIVSPYDGSSCEILHRHSDRDPFHHQKGQYSCLSRALDYIIKHDRWYIKKREASGQCH